MDRIEKRLATLNIQIQPQSAKMQLIEVLRNTSAEAKGAAKFKLSFLTTSGVLLELQQVEIETIDGFFLIPTPNFKRRADGSIISAVCEMKMGTFFWSSNTLHFSVFNNRIHEEKFEVSKIEIEPHHTVVSVPYKL